MVKEALAVERSILFKDGDFEGFLPADQRNFVQTILSNYSYHPRNDELENNDELQQIIPYVWIVNPQTKQIFAYKRSSGENYSEQRLKNKWSCGLGGHIDKEDSEDPIQNAMMRELMEEVKISEYPQPKVVGYLNLNHDVHAVHFGVVAIVETTLPIEKGDDEMAECRMLSASELEELFSDSNNDIEEWTRQSWPYVRDYLKNI